MKTIYSNDCTDYPVVAARLGGIVPGTAYTVTCAGRAFDLLFGDALLTDDALLAVLLDRAELADAKDPSRERQKRVTMLKALKSGDDERGRDVKKRGPYKKRAT